ncbi:MAG: hypothetical protein JKY17_04065 [Magnetovibrio sp.]|nr:hypothetical protein [Magnetovibrio sp.]
MSHELRTPLNAIIGFSSTIKEGIFGPINNNKYQDYIDDINSSGHYLLDIINDILDVSAIEAGALRLEENEIDFNDITASIMRITSPCAVKGKVTVTNAISPDTPHIMADKRRCKQILLNLISNAIKFTPKGGFITIQAKVDPQIGLILSVTDTGIGMDKNEIELALSTFGQVDSGLNRKHEGTGLGLPLTKGLIAIHGGTVRLGQRQRSRDDCYGNIPQ